MSRVGAVVTTGIYCRPGCGGRPNPQNRIEFPTAAGAEAAGFRACLICRPYRDPPAFWTSPDLVCRAVTLVLEGALDRGTEEDLGRELGVSSRHLRRLFVEYIGATPNQLARSARAHFARRLLDDTDLPVADIAFAAGFGSLRQFNRVTRDVFRLSPTELRARRRKKDRLVADGGFVCRLSHRGALDWDAMLAWLEDSSVPGVEATEGGTYRRTVRIDGDPGVLEISRADPGELLLRAHLPHWREMIHIVQRARRIFNLDAGVDLAETTLSGDPLLAPLLAKRPGLRPPGCWDPFEAAVGVIVHSDVGAGGSRAAMGRLVEKLGTPFPGLGPLGLTHLFPPPSVLADEDLTPILPARPAARVRRLARAICAEADPLISPCSLDALVAPLAETVGLDVDSAQAVALRLGERDAFPAGDGALRERLGALAGRPLDATDAAGLAERWRPWRAHAAALLLCA